MYTFNQFYPILIYPENFDGKYGVLEDEDIEETDLPCVEITFNVPLKKNDLDILLKYITRFKYIHITLRNYESNVWNDLSFLGKFKRIDSFRLSDNTFDAVNELKYLPRDLKFLNLNATKKKLDLKFLIKFQMLNELVIEKQSKNLDTVGKLKNLTSLTIRSITLPNLDVFLPLSNQLESLDIKLGGIMNLESLPKFTKLKYIELWQIRKFTDLTPVFKTKSLECIFIQSLRNVVQLPNMKELINLKFFHIENMKGLYDFTPINDAPVLEDLRLVDMIHLKPEDIEPLVGHPTLKYFRAGLGSLKKNNVVEKMIPLPENYGRCTYS
jgi:hypothetical protein